MKQLLILLVLVIHVTAFAQTAEESFSRSELLQDFDFMLERIESTHPDIAYSLDTQVYGDLKAQVKLSLHDNMTMKDAWLSLSLVNPAFRDAHTGVLRPRVLLETVAGRLLPLHISVDGDSKLIAAQMHHPEIGSLPGVEILAINGVSADAIVQTLLPRMRGETTRLRALVLSRYFAEYFWLAFGGLDTFTVVITSADGPLHLEVSATDSLDESARFSYAALPDRFCLLQINTFEIQHQQEFEPFIDEAFAEIFTRQCDRLIIDLRQNGGGARELSNYLADYIADRPLSSSSQVKARITSANQALVPGSELGQVLDLPYQIPVPNSHDKANRFDGKTYLWIGPQTYSQAIVFAATMQDHQLATLIGQNSEGPANQTGQVQSIELPNSTLTAVAPLYIFTRASGQSGRAPLMVEVEIDDTTSLEEVVASLKP